MPNATNQPALVIPPARDLYFPNIVCDLNLTCKPPLIEVARIMQGKYDDNGFPAVVCKILQTGATVTIFQTGHAVITGSKAVDDPTLTKPGIETALLTAQYVLFRLRHAYQEEIHITKIRIPNVVGALTLGVELNIDKMCVDYNAHREEGRFPGLRISDEDLHATFIVFNNGSINIIGMGGTVTGEVKNLDAIRRKIEEFRAYAV